MTANTFNVDQGSGIAGQTKLERLWLNFDPPQAGLFDIT